MRTLRVGNWLEATAQYCRAEFGLGFLLSVLAGRHLTASLLIGPLDASLDLWLPQASAEDFG